MKELLLILVSSAIVNNVVLSQFLGLCPFFGVSKRIETAAGMGGAIIFVITLSSFVTGLIYNFILVPTGMEYLQTIVFILIIAALVQFVEMFLKKGMPALYQSLGVYLPLITTNCAVLWCCPDKRTEKLQYPSGNCKRICNSSRIYDLYHPDGWYQRKN